jgi:type IV secretion system protein VirB11
MPLPTPDVAVRRSRVLMSHLGTDIAAALREADVVEIMVNPDGQLWVERIGVGRQVTDHRLTPAHAEAVIRLVAAHMGEVVNDQLPMIAGVLPEGGERFQGVLPPLARAPCFTIRKRPEMIFPLGDYVDHGTMTEDQADVLRDALDRRANILIAGGTGSGKTTLANALLAEPAFRDERVVIIEDTPELQCAAPDRIELLTKRTPPPVTMTDLVRMTLRLRPDRIVIGEVRGGEALDMLKAMNTGHPGSLTTVHANSAHDALFRLEDLVGEASLTVPRRTIAAAIDLIVHIERTATGRIVREIAAVELDAEQNYRLLQKTEVSTRCYLVGAP